MTLRYWFAQVGLPCNNMLITIWGLKHFHIGMVVWMTGLTSGGSSDFPRSLGKVPTVPPLQWVLGLNFGEHTADYILL